MLEHMLISEYVKQASIYHVRGHGTGRPVRMRADASGCERMRAHEPASTPRARSFAPSGAPSSSFVIAVAGRIDTALELSLEPGLSMNSSSPDVDRAALAAVHAAWVAAIAAIAASDADALGPLLADDYELWANGAEPLRGRNSAVAAMRGALARYRIAQSFEPIETVIAGDWAFERGLDRMTITPLEGGPSQSLTQRALLVLRRGTDGAWKYARGMTNQLPADPDSATGARGV
jgi:ketosteroid isomerase-like protein